MNRVAIQPRLLEWAQQRAGLATDTLVAAFSKYEQWLTQEESPTMHQLEQFADKTHTPLGYLFLAEPPEDRLPIPDFRTLDSKAPRRPTPDLLETVQTLQLRQEWMRDYIIEQGKEPLPFVRSISTRDDPVHAAAKMREHLNLGEIWAADANDSDDALRILRRKIEESGVFIFINGVVGNSTSRKLNTDEFRGFTLSDDYAPFIFINNNDAKAAQFFTLAHELVHVWLGEGGVSNPEVQGARATQGLERFCDQTAAEFLVPQSALLKAWETVRRTEYPLDRLASVFKVSRIVVARRAMDMGLISRDQFSTYFNACMIQWRAHAARGKEQGRGGGSFWPTFNMRLSDRFGAAVVRAVRTGSLHHSEAYELTGLRGSSFETYAQQQSNRLNR